MSGIFTDEDADNQFRRNGYVVGPFLDEDELGQIRQLYASLAVDIPTEMYTTTLSGDLRYRKQVFDGITAIIDHKLKEMIPECTPCMTAFATKAARSEAGAMQLHQDWSFVDHTLNPAVNIWCPLVDVDETNGGLKIVPGSHTMWGHIGVSSLHAPPIQPVMEILEAEFTVPVTIPAGWAVFYDPRLLHGSDENSSTEDRVAVVCCTIPRHLSPQLYYAADPAPTTLEIYEVSSEFLSRCAPGQRPDGVKQIGVLDYAASPLEPSDLDALRMLQHELVGTSPTPLDSQIVPARVMR